MDPLVASVIGATPVVGKVAQAYDNYRYLTDYMSNRGISDLKYPFMATKGISSGISSGGATLSKNILQLYDD